MTTKAERSAAASRGWDTRRENEAARKRSEAAARGWDTRRENERQAEQAARKRSEAASRGWDTRRESERKREVTPPKQAPREEKLGPRKSGYPSERARQRDRRTSNYRDHWRGAKDAGLGRGQFERLRNQAYRTKSNAPGGRKARYLEMVGVRDKDAKYPVGKTPKRKGK